MKAQNLILRQEGHKTWCLKQMLLQDPVLGLPSSKNFNEKEWLHGGIHSQYNLVSNWVSHQKVSQHATGHSFNHIANSSGNKINLGKLFDRIFPPHTVWQDYWIKGWSLTNSRRCPFLVTVAAIHWLSNLSQASNCWICPWWDLSDFEGIVLWTYPLTI